MDLEHHIIITMKIFSYLASRVCVGSRASPDNTYIDWDIICNIISSIPLLWIIEQLWHDKFPDVKDRPEGCYASARLLYGVAWGQMCFSHVV